MSRIFERVHRRSRLFGAIGVLSIGGCLDVESPPDAVSVLAIVAGNDQTVQTGMSIPTPFTVRAFNMNAQSVPDIPVKWTLTSGGGTLSSTSTTTDDIGQSSVGYTAGSTPGTAVVTASAKGLIVTFSTTIVTATQGGS